MLAAVAGTAATAIPAVRARDWAAHLLSGHLQFGTGLWLAAAAAALAAAALLVRAISTPITCMYQDRQETRRAEIGQHGPDLIAEAIAQVILATRTKAENLPKAKEMEEAARVRASAREVVAAVLQIPSPAASPEGPEAAPRELIDPVRMN